MGSVASAFVCILTGLFLFPAVVAAVETENVDYRQTTIILENPDSRDLITRIRKEIKRNDHTAKVLVGPQQKSLLIIHHKSIGTKELETVIANIGIFTKAVVQDNYKTENNSILSNSFNYSAGGIRNCGATKEAWKRLFHKYFY